MVIFTPSKGNARAEAEFGQIGPRHCRGKLEQAPGLGGLHGLDEESPEHALCAPDAPQPDRCWSDRGGDVEGFDWIEGSFSMVTAPPASLSPAQRAPHFDAVDPGYLAVLHYLSDTSGSGTAFYRQRSTGIVWPSSLRPAAKRQYCHAITLKKAVLTRAAKRSSQRLAEAPSQLPSASMANIVRPGSWPMPSR